MSDCFSRGLACSSVLACSRRGCQRKATGFDPVDRAAAERLRNACAIAARRAIMVLPADQLVSRDAIAHAVEAAIRGSA